MIIEQKLPGVRGFLGRAVHVFAFDDKALTYRLRTRKGIVDERIIPWQVVPARHYFREMIKSSEGSQRLIAAATFLVFLLLFTVRGDQDSVTGIFVFSAIFYLFCFVYMIWQHKPLTEIPVEGPGIEIYRGKGHDELVHAILDHRRRHFLQFATIEPEQTIRQNLRRLRWLVEIDVLSPAEFQAFQNRLLPNSPQTFLTHHPEIPPTKLRQQRNLTRVEVEFHASHFSYLREGLGIGRIKLNANYLDLPTTENLPKRPFTSRNFAACLLALGAFSIAVSDFWIDPAGNPGDGWFLAPEALLFWGALTSRIVYMHGMQIFQGVFLIMGVGPNSAEQIWQDLKGRKVTALRNVAQPDALLTDDEYAAKLEHLRGQNILSVDEVAHHLAQARAMINPSVDQLPSVIDELEAAATLH